MTRATRSTDQDVGPTSAKYTVLNYIRTGIRQGLFKPGQPILERELAEACPASRTAIREALAALVADRTLVREHGHSPVVRQFTREEVLAHHQIREALEGMAAGLAAMRHDQAKFHPALREIAAKLEQTAAAGDIESYLQANNEFHALIIEMSGNPFIQVHIDDSFVTQLRMQGARFMNHESVRTSEEDHRDILDAILRADVAGAEAAMRSHIRGTKRIVFDIPDTLFRPS